MENIVLTPKQQRFCDEYLIDLNATQAALRAGYSGSTALNGKLMTIPKIRYYLQQRTEEVSQKAKVNHEMVLGELMKTAFSNMRNYYRGDGSLKGMHELTDDEAAALWCIKVTDGKDGQSSFIRLNNKLSALEKIAKHLRFYDAEAPQPEKVYVYLDPEKLDEDDTFDDELFDNEHDDEEEFYDDEDDEYYPWDTECKVAVAQARAACKARRAGSGTVEAGSEEEEVAVAGEEEGVADEDDEEWGVDAEPEPPKQLPLPAPEYLTDAAVAMLMKPKCPPLAEGWLTAKKVPAGFDASEHEKVWKAKVKLWKQGIVEEEEESPMSESPEVGKARSRKLKAESEKEEQVAIAVEEELAGEATDEVQPVRYGTEAERLKWQQMEWKRKGYF